MNTTMTPDTKENDITALESPRRLQLVLSPDAYNRLVSVREKRDATSLAEVIRDALRVYEWFVDQEKEGYDIGLVKDNRVEKTVKLIL